MSNGDTLFVQGSVLDIFIPEASELDIQEALGASKTSRNIDDSALVTSIPQRNLLFFGMSVIRAHLNLNLTHS